ncbi:signal peptidase I [Leekyejoonella antrihumi]|uniref:signal peptidase I n=1 Tax=Leekyejoonella antrihumi TaxID=1660198 RepID=UPI0016457EF8|nr:signal peptidase I [Leekyejoonella antrihumi]
MTSREVTSSPVSRRRRWLIVVLVIVLLVVLVRGIFFETFTVPTGSMEPGLRPGDQIVVWKIGEDHVHRGEVIVFNATDAFGLAAGDSSNAVVRAIRSAGDAIGIRTDQTDYVKRVIGLPGDKIVVGHDGVLTVNGHAVKEPYLPAGMKASKVPLRVVVQPGCLFVMGDNRPASDDSRNHLGSPGGGCVPIGDVIGKVVLRYWPIGSWERLRS